MGLYDTVIVEKNVNLPKFEGDPSEIEWQTKDLNSLMDIYKITSSGKLLRKNIEKEERSEEELNKKAEEKGYDSYEEMVEDKKVYSIAYKMKKVDEWWEEIDIHGSFKFYSTIDDKRWTYEARFSYGSLDDIILIDKKQI